MSSRFKITVQHELHDGVNGLVSRADPQQLDDVLVIEPLHHLGFAQEIYFFLEAASDFQCFYSNSDLQRKETIYNLVTNTIRRV